LYDLLLFRGFLIFGGVGGFGALGPLRQPPVRGVAHPAPPTGHHGGSLPRFGLGTDPDQVKRKEEVVERRTLFERRCLEKMS
jgi:hypothetical protein